MGKTASITSPDVPECERLASIRHTGFNQMIQDFMEHILGLSRFLAATELPPRWWIAVSEIDIHALLQHLRCTSDVPWEDEIILKFWEWLVSHCEVQEANSDHEIRLTDLRIEPLLYQFFGIDQKKLEDERREILAACRAGNTLAEARGDLGLDD